MAKRSIKQDIIEKLYSWDEVSMFKIGGVGNLSRSDLDMLLMYVDCIEKYGTYEGYLMPPLGSMKKVLEVYGYVR